MNLVQATNEMLGQSTLTAAELRIANRLLAEVHPDNGHITLTWEQFQSIAGGVSKKTARNRLTVLKKAKLIHFSTNEYIDITFEPWRQVAESRDETPRTGNPFPDLGAIGSVRDSLDKERVPESGKNLLEIREPIPGNPPTPPERSEGVNSTLPEPEPTHSDPAQLTPEQERTRQMLLDGAGLRSAQELARVHAFDHCRGHLLEWLAERERNPKLKPGALDWRIRNNPTPQLPGNLPARVQAFGDQWPTDTEQKERDAWASMAEPTSAPVLETNPAPPPLTIPAQTCDPVGQPLWERLLPELALQMTAATFNRLLHPTWAHGYDADAGELVIGTASPDAQARLQETYARSASHALSMQMRRTVRVIFQHIDVVAAPAGGVA